MSLLAAACGADQGVRTTGATQRQPTGAETASPPISVDNTGTTPTATTPPAATVPPVTLPPIIEPELKADIDLASVVDIGDSKIPRAHDDFLAVALTDVQQWWARVYPDVYGEPFEPLEGGIYAGYAARQGDLPGCGEPSTSYDDLTQFAAFYCQFGDFMIYDDDDSENSILTPLADDLGAAVMGVVLAHEYGHAIQERTGVLAAGLPTIRTEQQADCFAGAWTGQAYRGESELLRLGDRDLRTGLIAMLTVRDPVGTDQFDEGGHGSAFDRVGAFQEGFGRGPARCAELIEDPLPLMPNQFQPQSVDALLGGNAPYRCEELIGTGVSQEVIDACTPAPTFLSDDLNSFWTTAIGPEFPTLTLEPTDDLGASACDDGIALADEVVLCPSRSSVIYLEPAVLDLYREFGDFTLGYFLGLAWGETAQRVNGNTLEGEKRSLLNDCYTGAWVQDITPDSTGQTNREDSDVQSSPGDLDEAIRMAILEGDEGANVNRVGSPFEKIEDFRIGVLGGLDACDALFAD